MTQREAFEAWYRSRHPRYPAEWEAWQAATAAERERCAKICDFMAKIGAEDRMQGVVVIATGLAAVIREG